MRIPRTTELLDLSHTMAAPLLEQCVYPFEAVGQLRAFLAELIPTLPPSFRERFPGVWIEDGVTVAPTAYLCGPAVICAGTEIRHCAYLRGSVLIGRDAVVGNSTELKNAILFDGVQVPHFNYIGDSVLGFRAHTGAGVIASNVRSDKRPVVLHAGTERMETGLRKLGAVLGDRAEIGCNSVLCPGAVVGRDSIVYPLSRVRGCVDANSIFKDPLRTVLRTPLQ